MIVAPKTRVSAAPREIARRGNLYFAYGANMSIPGMRARCPGAKLLGTATLDGYRFRINRDGFATVVADGCSSVFGALWHLTARDLRALDIYEEVGRGVYLRTRLDVRPPNGGATSAIVYLATDPDPGRPRRRYMRGIIGSARHFKFPAAYLRELAQWEGRAK